MFGLMMAFGCTGAVEDTAETPDVCAEAVEVTDYAVDWSTAPEAVAGDETTLSIAVRDQRGCPIPDLQVAHERFVHTLLISADLTSFQHLHHEDFTEITGYDIKDSAFAFPVTFPVAGDYRLVFDYAHQNQYVTTEDWLTVGGEPAQSAEPALDYTLVRTVDDLTVTLRWDVEPFAGFEASWAVTVTDAEGADVTDLVQWLGADGHAAVASADLAWVSHTHAWYPGMEDVPPGHDMAWIYKGPELPFHFTFPTPGPYKMWVQFARTDAPDTPYVADFAFDVAP